MTKNIPITTTAQFKQSDRVSHVINETPCPREFDDWHDDRGDDDYNADGDNILGECDHDWQELSGEPARDVCSSCGEER